MVDPARVAIVGVAFAALTLAACIIGPKQDDPAEAKLDDSGNLGDDATLGGGGPETSDAVAPGDTVSTPDAAPPSADGDACPSDGDACVADAAHDVIDDAINDGEAASDSKPDDGASSDAVSGG